ncbi:hypothetical protein BST47_07690 [Mycolicibacterium tusciae]|uniref:Uncharacterized protein n=1 Tax=Mycolicibacterium tusciae TaxID=75922 RepID=A0A1X0JVH6_9MYCO|nr:hypothetical protein BST47_07690 [Mycolicibacterium tusciae]
MPGLLPRAETFTEADVVQVEADMVLRLVRNPEGLYSEGDGITSTAATGSWLRASWRFCRRSGKPWFTKAFGMFQLVPTFGSVV